MTTLQYDSLFLHLALRAKGYLPPTMGLASLQLWPIKRVCLPFHTLRAPSHSQVATPCPFGRQRPTTNDQRDMKITTFATFATLRETCFRPLYLVGAWLFETSKFESRSTLHARRTLSYSQSYLHSDTVRQPKACILYSTWPQPHDGGDPARRGTLK